MPSKEPRPEKEIKSFIDSLSTNDAHIEVILGQGRLLTLKQDLVAEGEKTEPEVGVGSPGIVEFQIINPRQIRLIGLKFGVTDLSVTTAGGDAYSFEVHVVPHLDLLRARLKQVFPSAQLRLRWLINRLIVEGQARDSRQVAQILETLDGFLLGYTTTNVGQPSSGGNQQQGGQQPGDEDKDNEGEDNGSDSQPSQQRGGLAAGGGGNTSYAIINLIRVPGPQQVMLKVQVAELNRTAFRAIGLDFLFKDVDGSVGSRISGTAASFASLFDPSGTTTTVFGVLDNGKFTFLLDALRKNRVLKILAEPNLMAMNGQQASFLAGGEFPVPVPQSSGAGTSSAPTITIEWKQFGVQLDFQPFINDDGSIRLAVAPEVSSLDFDLGVEIQGFKIPSINKRAAKTVVELREGQTLAIAGLLQVTLQGNTSRIPGLGDLKYIGPFFSNTTSETVEKELIVLVTPYLVEAMKPGEVTSRPGDLVREPNDFEFFFLGRIEGRSCRDDYRATDAWDDPLAHDRQYRLEENYIIGPHGYSD